MLWYDLDLSTKPYKALKYHQLALRAVAFHRSYPLFASASDDGTIQVFHGMVYQVCSPSRGSHGSQAAAARQWACAWNPIGVWHTQLQQLALGLTSKVLRLHMLSKFCLDSPVPCHAGLNDQPSDCPREDPARP